MKISAFSIKVLSTLLCVVLSTAIAFAQPDDNGGDPPGADVPIDGGLSILLAAGVAYGAKKGYDQQKKKKQAEGGTDVSEK